jgi:predicted aldo/keto reductase-like oxidoreductase
MPSGGGESAVSGGRNGLDRRILGRTGIEVTELCFGALPFGPLQKGLPPSECAEILETALRGGVGFVDTAQMYGTYAPIRAAMQASGLRPIIASKSTAPDRVGMEAAVEEARLALGVEKIDIFHIHAARAGASVLEERREALQALIDLKAARRVGAIGLSAHSVLAVRAAAACPDIDVVFPLLNLSGAGILDGNRATMEAAVTECARAGKGVYLMKALAGGSLVGRYREALEYARSVPGVSSIALGMVSIQEVERNLAVFGAPPGSPLPFPDPSPTDKRFMAVPILCRNCGACIPACPSHSISERGGKAWIDPDTCLRCGYCVPACPQFAIRMV